MAAKTLACIELRSNPRGAPKQSLSPSSRRGVYTVTRAGASTHYTITKHALWCLLLEGQALPIGRYARLVDALAAAVSHMEHSGRARG